MITKDQADKLEVGDLLPSDLDLQLRPWLFCGEEPVAGVILEETGEKITLNEACKRTLLRRGTTLELLEAQAAVGCVIDPIRYIFQKLLFNPLVKARRSRGYTGGFRALISTFLVRF